MIILRQHHTYADKVPSIRQLIESEGNHKATEKKKGDVKARHYRAQSPDTRAKADASHRTSRMHRMKIGEQ